MIEAFKAEMANLVDDGSLDRAIQAIPDKILNRNAEEIGEFIKRLQKKDRLIPSRRLRKQIIELAIKTKNDHSRKKQRGAEDNESGAEYVKLNLLERHIGKIPYENPLERHKNRYVMRAASKYHLLREHLWRSTGRQKNQNRKKLHRHDTDQPSSGELNRFAGFLCGFNWPKLNDESDGSVSVCGDFDPRF